MNAPTRWETPQNIFCFNLWSHMIVQQMCVTLGPITGPYEMSGLLKYLLSGSRLQTVVLAHAEWWWCDLIDEGNESLLDFTLLYLSLKSTNSLCFVPHLLFLSWKGGGQRQCGSGGGDSVLQRERVEGKHRQKRSHKEGVCVFQMSFFVVRFISWMA